MNSRFQRLDPPNATLPAPGHRTWPRNHTILRDDFSIKTNFYLLPDHQFKERLLPLKLGIFSFQLEYFSIEKEKIQHGPGCFQQ